VDQWVVGGRQMTEDSKAKRQVGYRMLGFGIKESKWTVENI
jgi:hypothetical protein